MKKKYLTTGEFAEICSVTPDTVLKWIKEGKLNALQTLGGHYRISKNALPASFLVDEIKQSEPEGSIDYCWVFHNKSENLNRDCLKCNVYQVRAQKCYEMAKISESGHSRRYCKTSCINCDFFKIINN